jgi:hypothetical protein
MIGMGVDDSLEVIGVCLESDSSYSAVEHDIVKKNIANSVKSDTDGHRGVSKLTGNITEKKEQNGYAAKKDGKKIVLLKSEAARFVMVFVKNPEKSMHDIFVGCPGNKLHETGKKDDNADV